jgi:predicted restriction endonuclease
MAGKPWTRDEILLAIRLYCTLPYRKLKQTTPEVIELAGLLGRTPSAVSMRCCNYVQMDPVESQRVTGLTRIANLDKDVWADVVEDWEAFADDCERIDASLRSSTKREGRTQGQAGIDPIGEVPTGADIVRARRERSGQSFFRATVLAAYDRRCCVSGLRTERLLIASHIKPWKCADPKTERTNPRNGLCLSPLYDKALDVGLMTVDRDCKIVLSRKILEAEPEEAVRRLFRSYHGRWLLLPERFRPDQEFLDFHRTHVFDG